MGEPGGPARPLFEIAHDLLFALELRAHPIPRLGGAIHHDEAYAVDHAAGIGLYRRMGGAPQRHRANADQTKNAVELPFARRGRRGLAPPFTGARHLGRAMAVWLEPDLHEPRTTRPKAFVEGASNCVGPEISGGVGIAEPENADVLGAVLAFEGGEVAIEMREIELSWLALGPGRGRSDSRSRFLRSGRGVSKRRRRWARPRRRGRTRRARTAGCAARDRDDARRERDSDGNDSLRILAPRTRALPPALRLKEGHLRCSPRDRARS